MFVATDNTNVFEAFFNYCGVFIDVSSIAYMINDETKNGVFDVVSRFMRQHSCIVNMQPLSIIKIKIIEDINIVRSCMNFIEKNHYQINVGWSFNESLFEYVLIHELFHVIQTMEGKIFYDFQTDDLFWNGQKFSRSVGFSMEEHASLPWEFDANTRTISYMGVDKSNLDMYNSGNRNIYNIIKYTIEKDVTNE